MNIGKRLEYWVAKNGRETNGLHLIRLNDSGSFGGSSSRHKVPFDFVGIYQGIPIAIECKATSKNRLPKKNLKDHQIKGLYDWKNSKGLSLLVCVVGKTIWVLDPVKFLSMSGASIPKSERKVVWSKLNLKELIDEQLER